MKTTNEAKTVTAPRYICSGSVRGDCGHNHLTVASAAKCLAKDQRGCRSLGGGAYSDRRIIHANGDGLTEAELDLWEIACGREVES